MSSTRVVEETTSSTKSFPRMFKFKTFLKGSGHTVAPSTREPSSAPKPATAWTTPDSFEEEGPSVRTLFDEMEQNIHTNAARGLSVLDGKASSPQTLFERREECSARDLALLDDKFVDAMVPLKHVSSERRLDEAQGAPPLLRTNSTGSLHIDSMLNDPDVKAVIHCMCLVLHGLMTEAGDANGATFSNCNIKGSLAVFDDRHATDHAMPTVAELVRFVRMVYSRGEMHVECIVTAFIFVVRLLRAHDGALAFTPANWRSIVFSTMILASKVCDDESPVNADWCYVCPEFTVRRINQLELALLAAYGFQPTVRASEYARSYFYLRSIATRLRLVSGDTNLPLDVKVARRMAAAKTTNPHKQNPDTHAMRTVEVRPNRATSFADINSPPTRRPPNAALEHLVNMSPKQDHHSHSRSHHPYPRHLSF